MSLARVLIFGSDSASIRELSSALSRKGISCTLVDVLDQPAARSIERAPDLIMVSMNGLDDHAAIGNLVRRANQESRLPVLALVTSESLHELEANLPVDDFVIKPWHPDEVELRVKRILRHKTTPISMGCIECGDLVIDVENCEVRVAGRLATLTFREYELLRFLARNRGRVFSREALLDEVWGYEYYGGDRTVDVHIKRLRSKIEDQTHVFIETVRNMGYRFRKDPT